MGGTLLTTNLNEAKQLSNITVGNQLTDIISGAEVWQNRVWLEWRGAPGREFWSAPNDITKFVNYDVENNISTGAGVFEVNGKILAFKTLGNIGVIFTDVKNYICRISSIDDVYFTFNSSDYSEQFAGGAIVIENSLYFVSTTGINVMSMDGSIQHISNNLDNIIINAVENSTEIKATKKR